MKSMNVNSLRLDFRWQNIEQFEGIYNFELYDLVIFMAEKYDMKIFGLLGALGIPQWAPGLELAGQQGNNIDPGWMSVS
jgi:beta-galactosidase GanA